MSVHVALVHHPVLDRAGAVVTTGVTNVDLHDIARAARSYDVDSVTFVTPIAAQMALVERIVAHWRDGEGRAHNATRAMAFERVGVARSIDAVVEGLPPGCALVGTSARPGPNATTYAALRARLKGDDVDALLLFGTGWGLAPSALSRCDHILPPIEAFAGRRGYNHLSVRSAAAIVLDRLLGEHDEHRGSP